MSSYYWQTAEAQIGLYAYLLIASKEMLLYEKSLPKEQLPQTAPLCGSFRRSRKERQTSCSWHRSRRLVSRRTSTLQSRSWGSAGVSDTAGSAEPLIRLNLLWPSIPIEMLL